MPQRTVLIVDDNSLNRELLQEILEEEYKVITAEDGKEAIDVFEKNKNSISVILLDINMPKINGYEVMEYMREHCYMSRVPILMISSEESNQSEKMCLNLGASDFIRKPFDMQIVRLRVNNIAENYEYKHKLEEKVEEQTREIMTQNIRLKKQTDNLMKTNDNIINILGAIVESRDLESGEHVCRVREYTRIIATQMMKDYPEYNLTNEKVNVIASASALHDIGKVEIPDHILLKPGRFTTEEFDLMKTHTIRGCRLIKKIKGAWDEQYGRYSYEICKYHHERYDGKGYPEGLCGDEIPISAQCVSISDVYDALVNERCYKAAYSTQQAFDMIMSGQCGVFSPKLLSVFEKTRSSFENLATS